MDTVLGLIVQPYASLVSLQSVEGGKAALRFIEAIARVSHGSEDAQTEDSWERFIKAVVLDRGDWSVVEHYSVTVDALVDRGITHEWVRHRLFAYTQESTRFVNYEKKRGLSFVLPYGLTESQRAIWQESVQSAAWQYQKMLADGCTPQIARSVLPTSVASRLVVTGNLRNWRHFLLMRTTRESHPQMRQVTVPLLHEFQEKVPLLFADIEPGARQADNLKKMR